MTEVSRPGRKTLREGGLGNQRRTGGEPEMRRPSRTGEASALLLCTERMNARHLKVRGGSENGGES